MCNQNKIYTTTLRIHHCVSFKSACVIGILFWIALTNAQAQLISIATARALPVGSVVNVEGVCLNGFELGSIRYIQDATGGIAVFSTSLSTTTTGDEVNVTGVTVQYSNLLEIQPVNSWALNSSGNALPAPALITPTQMDEPYESQLVRIDDATFANGGSLFQANTTYQFNAIGQSGVMYVRTGSALVGTLIPFTSVDLIGICTQYQTQYQLLLRSPADMISNSAVSILNTPYQTNIVTTGFDVNWQTNVNSSSQLLYGKTPALELGILTGTGNVTSHTVAVTGVNPSDVIYVQAISVLGTDTAFSEKRIFITASGSTGEIKTYFNRTVDINFANPANNIATQLNYTIDDTLKAYMDRAVSTIDIAIYSFDDFNVAKITQGINDAYNRGVQIRVIADGQNVNAGLSTLNSNIPILLSPDTPANYYSIMHNKFVIIDAASSDVNLPIVWTGSTNWSDNQLYTDANNVIIIQDKSLAKAYTIEFEEMWGSSGAQYNLNNIKFGPKKTNNTPHEFLINGKRIENYFSPSDNVNAQIERTIQTANSSLQFAIFVFTRTDLAYAVQDRVWNNVDANGMVDDSSSGGGFAFSIMENVMNNKIILYDHNSLQGILHHKYLIVDQDNPASDALVLTGSHNWSTTANTKNDENTLMVHDASIANQYYQEFVKRFNESGGGLYFYENSESSPVSFYPNPTTENLYFNWEATSLDDVTITIYDAHGKVVFIKNDSVKQFVNINVSSFMPGLYQLVLQNDKRRICTKFVKQ